MAISNVLALDVGERRIGVAVASLFARLPHPLVTLDNNDTFWNKLGQLITTEQVSVLVVGLPRGMSGQETAQTAYARDFARELESRVNLPVHLQDEALTSRQAEAELIATKKPYSKGDIDALAATYILSDFLGEYKGDDK
ncbi:MAG: putative Holliday junction resolvase [Candidatus Saccharibacteria bacterium]|nr:putative Holliday junction resolvase [Candidatus Saccharibacteria bacterium]